MTLMEANLFFADHPCKGSHGDWLFVEWNLSYISILTQFLSRLDGWYGWGLQGTMLLCCLCKSVHYGISKRVSCQNQVYRCLSFIKSRQRFNPCSSYFNEILASLINWHLIWLSAQQLWKTVPSFTTPGKAEIITRTKPVSQKPSCQKWKDK